MHHARENVFNFLLSRCFPLPILRSEGTVLYIDVAPIFLFAVAIFCVFDLAVDVFSNLTCGNLSKECRFVLKVASLVVACALHLRLYAIQMQEDVSKACAMACVRWHGG